MDCEEDKLTNWELLSSIFDREMARFPALVRPNICIANFRFKRNPVDQTLAFFCVVCHEPSQHHNNVPVTTLTFIVAG
jgi:hypothetical protein